jgi:hypothetical protein
MVKTYKQFLNYMLINNCVFHTVETNKDNEKELVAVSKNIKGYFRIDNGYYGESKKIDNLAKELNKNKGYSEKQAMDIIITSY